MRECRYFCFVLFGFVLFGFLCTFFFTIPLFRFALLFGMNLPVLKKRREMTQKMLRVVL